jgi:PiT family inorganic phosphate transporter
MDIWLLLTLLLSFLMAFSIGSNDAANGLGTSYGTKALPLRMIIFNGALAEFFGAMFCSDKVAVTLSSDIVKDLTTLPADY